MNWKFLPFCSLLVICLFTHCMQDTPYATDAATIARGEELFEAQCSSCHNFKAGGIGPNLAGVTQEVSPQWLRKFIRNSQAVIESGDDRAEQLFEQYQQYMMPFNLSDEELDAILAYMHTFPAPYAAADNQASAKPLENPIPDTIPPSGITLTLREILQAPATSDKSPVTRINKMYPLPGQSGRVFLQDLQGQLYEFKDNQLLTFMEIVDYRPHFINKPGLATGFGSFAFHPEYESNGLFYTTHTENPETSTPADFGYHDTIPIKVRWVLTEWHQDDPTSSTFSGESRELFRIDMVSQIHGLQDITFNPLARPGDDDYGLLYISVGDGGCVRDGYPFLTQDKSKPWGSIVRIDPADRNSANGNYGIPEGNPYAQDDDPNTLGELWAQGFRNPHRLTWDAKDRKLLASGIGQKQIEEVNIIEAGRNYGWPEREGTFLLNKHGDIQYVYPLQEDIADDGFTYPVVQFDHDEAAAISGGYVYYGEDLPDMQGKYIFGGIVNGRVFAVNAAELELGKQAPIQEIALQLENGTPTTMRELTGINRVDLRFGIDAAGELYIFTKADGKIYRVVESIREQAM